MSIWLTVVVPAAVTIGTAVYTTGGRAALTRTAIKQELDTARMLPPGVERAGMELSAQRRAGLYAAQRLRTDKLSLPQQVLYVAAACVAWCIAAVLAKGAVALHNYAAVQALLVGLQLFLLGLSGWWPGRVIVDGIRATLNERKQALVADLANQIARLTPSSVTDEDEAAHR